MKLDVKALAIALGVLWGLAIFLTAVANLIWPTYGRTFLEVMGVEFGELQEGNAWLKFEVREDHCRTGGILHGGATATLLDTLCGMAAATAIPATQDLVTAQLNINYVRPAVPGETLTGHGHVEHRGKRTLICRSEVRRPDGQLLAMATATMMILDARVGGPPPANS